MSWNAHHKIKQLLTFSSARELETVNGFANNSQKENESNIDARGSHSNKPDKKRSYKPVQLFGLILGPLLFALTLLFFSPAGLEPSARAVLATTLWIATWWITEAIPIPITSLLPHILLPVTQASEGSAVAASYGDPIIFLFLGGFLIAIAMEKWDLHKRIAVLIVTFIGTSPKQIVLGFMLATGFLSMWVSNTAAVMMMIPIGTAITHQALVSVRKAPAHENSIKIFEKAVIFGIGFTGTIGGLGTLIGTPPNIILAATIQTLYGIEVSFATWLFFAFPVVLVLLFCSWYYLVNMAFLVKLKELPGGKQLNVKEALLVN